MSHFEHVGSSGVLLLPNIAAAVILAPTFYYSANLGSLQKDLLFVFYYKIFP